MVQPSMGVLCLWCCYGVPLCLCLVSYVTFVCWCGCMSCVDSSSPFKKKRANNQNLIPLSHIKKK